MENYDLVVEREKWGEAARAEEPDVKESVVQLVQGNGALA